jgi:hypothetical protein
MNSENSDNSRTVDGPDDNDGDDQVLPEIDFWIHMDQHGMRSGFKPHNKMTGDQVVLCMSIGIRGMCCMLAERMELPLEIIYGGLLEGMQSAFSEKFADETGIDDDPHEADDYDDGLGDGYIVN